jgi:hypothetical protein
MQDKATFSRDWSAIENRGTGDLLVRVLDRQLLKQPAQVHVGGAIDNNTERTFVIMFTNECDRSAEIRVGHTWHRYQQVIIQ